MAIRLDVAESIVAYFGYRRSYRIHQVRFVLLIVLSGNPVSNKIK